MRKSSYFNTKYLDFKNYLYKIRHYYVIYTKVINRTSLKSFREAVTQQKRTAPPGVDAAETVRFSWKVVEPQGQREHDVRVSWLTPRMASVSGPVMMKSTWPLSFRKSTVVASIRVWGGQLFLRGFYDTPTLRAMHPIHKCVAKGAPHLFHWRLSPYKNRTKQPLVWASSHRGIPFYFCMARNSQFTVPLPWRTAPVFRDRNGTQW